VKSLLFLGADLMHVNALAVSLLCDSRCLAVKYSWSHPLQIDASIACTVRFSPLHVHPPIHPSLTPTHSTEHRRLAQQSRLQLLTIVEDCPCWLAWGVGSLRYSVLVMPGQNLDFLDSFQLGCGEEGSGKAGREDHVIQISHFHFR